MENARDTTFTFVYGTTGDKELANTASLLVKMADNGKLADKETLELTDSLKKLATQSKAVNDALSQKAALAETAARLTAAKEAAAKLGAELEASGASSKKAAAAFNAADKAVSDLTAKYNTQAVALAKTQGFLQKTGVDTKDLAAANAKLAEQAAPLAAKLNEVAKASGAVAQGTREAGRGAKTLGDESIKSVDALQLLKDNLGKIVSVAAAVKVALAGLEFGKESFAGAADVEQSLARVRAIAETTADSFGQLSEQIEKSAIAANVSTREAANAAAELAAQGQSASEIYQTLTPTILLAKDAQIEVAEAAGIVDDVLDLFNKSAGDAALVVDQLVTASKGSKDGLAGMAQAIRTLAPDARAIGLDFEHLVGLLATLGQNGFDAGKSAEALRGIFQKLKDPASEFSQALAGLGDSTGNFAKGIETIRNSGQRGQLALRGLDGAARSVVLFLLQQAPGAAEKFAASLGDVEGAASRTAKIIDGTLKGSFTSFENAIDRIGESLLSTSLGPLQTELQKLAGQLTEFAASPAFAQLEEKFRLVFEEAVKSFDKVVQDIDWNKLVDGAVDAVGRVGTAAKQIGDDAASIATAINGIATAIGKISAASDSLSGIAKAAFGATAKTITEGAKLAGEGVDALTGKTSAFTEKVTELDAKAGAIATGGFKQFADGATKLAGASDDAAKSVEKVAVSFDNVKKGAETTAPFQGAVSDFNAVTGATENVVNALSEVPGTIAGVTSAVAPLPELFNADAIATNAAADAHKAHTDQIDRAREAVEAAEAELVKLAQSGEKNSVAFQQASKALLDAQAALDKLTGKTKDAVNAQRALEAAFGKLRIQSQDTLQRTAEEAKTAFETIEQAFTNGKATVEDVRRAFEAYAAAQRASVADSDQWQKSQVEGQLAVQASLIGLGDKFKGAGDAAEDAGKRTVKAYDEAKHAVEDTGRAVEDTGRATASASKSQEGYTTSLKATAAAMGGIIAIGPAQAAALKLLNERLRESADLTNLSLNEAKTLLADLGPLAGAAAGLIEQRVRELEAAAQRAADTAARMADEAASLQDQIDQLEGNDTSIEDRRHERKLADLKAEAEANGTQNSAEYRRLIELENKLHELKLQNIRKEKGESGAPPPGAGGVGGRGGSGNGGGNPPPGPAPAPAPSNPPPTGGSGSGGVTVHVTVQGSVIGANPNTLADDLARLVRVPLSRIDNRGR